MKRPSESEGAASGHDTTALYARSLWERVRAPGLTPAANAVHRLAEELPKKLAVFSYKEKKTYLWAVFLGGTGTGKSTLFNAVCSEPLSETGVERPKTYGPIVYAHERTSIEKDFPFPSIRVRRLKVGRDSHHASFSGVSGEFLVLEHQREDVSHIAFVDTPDLDSLELHNREMAEDLYLISDVVVFVTSQEKYADEIPFQFLKRIHAEGKPYYLLLNKADADFARDEVLAAMRAQGLELHRNRLWLLPYLRSNPQQSLVTHPEYGDFAGTLFRELARSELPQFLRRERIAGARSLGGELQLLLDQLGKEREAAQAWLSQLDSLFGAAGRSLLEAQHERFSEESRQYLQEEIRSLFSKYDVLAKPRRLISQIVTTPLRLLGLVEDKTRISRSEALKRIRRKIDLSPIAAAIQGFNRAVLEKLSPVDDRAPLYRRIREPSVAMDNEEIKRRVWEEQDRLVSWLEGTFQQLAQGLPKSKEWGIYSTSILWGVLIISLETAIGGGISLLEALLDSAIAPFVTKGAAELFAYREIQRVARELAVRYEEGLISVVREQRDRYVECLMSLMTPSEVLGDLQALQQSLKREEKGRGRS